MKNILVIPRHEKMPLQHEILRLIMKEGQQSSISIQKHFKNSEFDKVMHESIVRTLTNLSTDEKIFRVGIENVSGGKRRIFNLKINGFKEMIEASKDECLSSEQFWKYLSNSKYSILEINEICDFYDSTILKIDRKYCITNIFFKNINNKEFSQYGSNPTITNNDSIKFLILQTISQNKSLNSTLIMDKLQSKNIDIFDIDGLLSDGLIIKQRDRYDLTHLGLLELFFSIYRDSKIKLYWNRRPNLIKRNKSEPLPIKFKDFIFTKDPKAIKIVKELERLRLKYSDLLPDIFKDENFNKLGITFIEVIILLLRLYKNFDFATEIGYVEKTSSYWEEYHILQGLDESRRKIYNHKILEHHTISDETLSILEMNQNIYYEYLNQIIIYDLDDVYPTILTEKSRQNSNKSEDQWKKAVHNQIQRKITFDFYSIYKAYLDGWENSKLSKSKIRQTHNQEIKTLLNFNNNYIKNLENSLE